MSHARLSPSNHRWVHCPGSIAAESEYPDISGDAAIDGTGSHLLLELCIKNSKSPAEYLGSCIGVGDSEKPQGWEVDQDRIDRVMMGINYLNRRKKELKKQFPGCTIDIKTEQKVNPGSLFGRNDWYGTSDIIITVTDENWRILLIEVADYKDGRLWVSAEDNSQLQSYAIGAVRHLCAVGPDGEPSPFRQNWDFNIRMTIVQPKSSTPIRYDDIKLSELLSVAKELNEAAKRTDDIDAPLIADSNDGKGWCRWCKHKVNCTALSSKKVERLNVMKTLETNSNGIFDVLQQPLSAIKDLSNEKLSELLDIKSTVDSLFKEVEDESKKRVEAGEKLPGYGMVPGRITRVWSEDADKVETALRKRRLKLNDIYEKKLRSPAQILKNKQLTSEQKERIERDFVTEKSSLKLGRVKREEKQVESLFENLPEVKQLPSFL